MDHDLEPAACMNTPYGLLVTKILLAMIPNHSHQIHDKDLVECARSLAQEAIAGVEQDLKHFLADRAAELGPVTWVPDEEGPRMGKTWHEDERQALAHAFDIGEGLLTIIDRHKRTGGSLKSQLFNMGRLVIGSGPNHYLHAVTLEPWQ